MSEPFLGEIRMVGFNFAPRGWSSTSGQLLPINQNQALFALLGTQFGGNGQTNFALPDLQGRLAIGMGNGAGLTPAVIGQFGGTENVSILTSNMPTHNHAVTGNISVATKVSTINRLANQPLPNGHILALSEANTTPPAVVKAYSDQASDGGALGGVSSAVTSTLGTGLTGNGLPISILQPYLVMNYVIALQGIFPSRS
jgi:microcystin-dependent protein